MASLYFRLGFRGPALDQLEGERGVRDGQGAQEEEKLEPPLRLGIRRVLDDDDPATPSGRRPYFAKDGDDVVDERGGLRRTSCGTK
jgi:hypothetical protein